MSALAIPKADATCLRVTAMEIAPRLGVTVQEAACLLLLAFAHPHPLTTAQLDERLPLLHAPERCDLGVIVAIIYRLRKRLGPGRVLGGRGGYWLSVDLRTRVLGALS
jgi:hypothetical protein